jgi:hypothetical protein
MSNALSPSVQDSNELGFPNLLGDVGGDFDIFMASQQLDIGTTAQNSQASKYLRFRETQTYQAKMIISGRTFNFRLGMGIVSNPRTTTLASISRVSVIDANVVSSSTS